MSLYGEYSERELAETGLVQRQHAAQQQKLPQRVEQRELARADGDQQLVQGFQKARKKAEAGAEIQAGEGAQIGRAHV